MKWSDCGSGCFPAETSERDLRPSVDDEVGGILIRRFKPQLFEELSLVVSQVRRETTDAHHKKMVTKILKYAMY